MKRNGWLLWILAVAVGLAVFSFGCSSGGGGDGEGPSLPSVVSTSPEHGDDELKLATVVVVRFNKPMDRESVEDAFSMSDVSGNFSWNSEGNQVTFTPSDILQENHQYEVTISDTASDTEGHRLQRPYTFAFRTVDLWTRTYNSPSRMEDGGYGITVDDEGNVYVTGIATFNDYDIWVRKYDKHGEEQWTQTYDGGRDGDDFGYGIAVDLQGNVYVTGEIEVSEDTTDLCLLKYDSDGDDLWVRTYNGSANSYDGGYGVAVDAEGNSYVVGRESKTGEYTNIFLRKYDEDGGVVWTKSIHEQGDETGYGVALDADGNIYITGFMSASGEWGNVWVSKRDTEGDELWTRTFNGPASSYDEGRGVAVDEDGNVYVIGTVSTVETYMDIWVRKYNPNGNMLWTQTYNGPAGPGDIPWDQGYGIAVDSEGNVYVTGHATVENEEWNIWVRKYDSNGNVLWTHVHNGQRGRIESGHGIAVDAKGNVYVTAAVNNEGDVGDIWIRKFDTDGNWGG